MSEQVIVLVSGEMLTIETEMIEVTSMLPRLDPHWKFVDQAGHEHHADGTKYQVEYPTLDVREREYYCYQCLDLHTESSWVCKLCSEVIEPGTTGPSPIREFIPGMTTYRMNGIPIPEERAREILADEAVARKR